MQPNKKISAILLILTMTFVGMYASFEIIKPSSYSWDSKWYHMFIVPDSYNSSLSTGDDVLDGKLNTTLQSYQLYDLSKIRSKFFIATFISFLLSLFFAYKFYYQDKNVGILWLILLISLYFIFFG